MVMRVSTDIKNTMRQLNRMQRNQVPFAASKALNDTAFDVRRFVVGPLWNRSFPQSRNKRFPHVIFRVRRAKKRDLRSEVFDRLDRYFLPLHIAGRDKTARGGRLAIPNTRHITRTATGRIPKRVQPANLPNSFVEDRGRGPALWQRQRDGSVRLMYYLRSTSRIIARFPFFRLGYAKGRQVWSKNMDRALRFALRTAR